MPPAPITALSRSLILLLAMVSALGPVAMQILLPGVPIIKESFAVSTGVAQLTLSLSMAAIALATLAYGPLSDRYGRRPVLIAGMSIAVVGSLLCMVAPTIELLIAGRFVQAAGGARHDPPVMPRRGHCPDNEPQCFAQGTIRVHALLLAASRQPRQSASRQHGESGR